MEFLKIMLTLTFYQEISLLIFKYIIKAEITWKWKLKS